MSTTNARTASCKLCSLISRHKGDQGIKDALTIITYDLLRPYAFCSVGYTESMGDSPL